MVEGVIIICILVALLYFFFLSIGLVGPKWAKDLIQRYERWRFGDAAVTPIDANHPLGKTLLESFNPTSASSQKWRRSSAPKVFLTILMVGLVLMIVALVVTAIR
jgi:hypothetical protein